MPLSLKTAAATTLSLARYLARNPQESRDLPRWLYARMVQGGPTPSPQPWLSFKALRFLDSVALPGTSVYEYGAGGSSLFLAKRGVNLHSVEHNAIWFERMNELRIAHHLSRSWRLNLVQPTADHSPEFRSAVAVGSFEAYARSIERFPDGSFDLVIVDGRARVACVSLAMPKVRVGGYLLLDDYKRSRYAEAVDRLSGWRAVELSGLVGYPKTGVEHRSIVWHRG